MNAMRNRYRRLRSLNVRQKAFNSINEARVFATQPAGNQRTGQFRRFWIWS